MIIAVRDASKDTIKIVGVCGSCMVFLKRETQCISFDISKDEWPECGHPSDNIKRLIENAVWQKKWKHIQLLTGEKLVNSFICMQCQKKALQGKFRSV